MSMHGTFGSAHRAGTGHGAFMGIAADRADVIIALERLGVAVNLYQASDAPLRRTTVGTMVLGLDGQRTLIDEALAHIADTEGLNAEVLP